MLRHSAALRADGHGSLHSRIVTHGHHDPHEPGPAPCRGTRGPRTPRRAGPVGPVEGVRARPVAASAITPVIAADPATEPPAGSRTDRLPRMSEANSAPERQGLTPRQARRVRIVLSTVIMALVGAVLALRLGSTHSVLTMGFYGVALIMSGSALVLSKAGRTRVATAVLGAGVALVLAAEWAVASLR